jgi:ATP-dependent Lon protease
MAWTQVGGEILFIEVSLSKGNGRIQVTGRLGETMQESVKTALSYVKANAVELGLNTHRDVFGEDIERALRNADLHVHFPQGAVPKDGPSAGVAITAALVSALSGLCVRNDTACTGEVTLRGLVLPVGGIKEKVLAAHRAGIKRVVLPARNEKDTLEIPQIVRDELQICFASTILEAMGLLFDPEVKSQPPAWRLRVQAVLKEEASRRNGRSQNQQPTNTMDEEDRAGGGNALGFKDMYGDVLRSMI